MPQSNSIVGDRMFHGIGVFHISEKKIDYHHLATL